MQRPTVENMAETVLSWFNGAEPKDKDDFKNTSDDDLTWYHNSLGMDIRNYFSLWAYDWEPLLDENGVDNSPEHPDAISMKVIQEVHKKVQ